MLEDEYVIRRRAVELGIPVLTNPETATVFVKSLEWMQKNKPTVDILAWIYLAPKSIHLKHLWYMFGCDYNQYE